MKNTITLAYNQDCGGYDNDLGCYVNCLTEVGDPTKKLWKIIAGKAYHATYEEGAFGKSLDDDSTQFLNGVTTCEKA